MRDRPLPSASLRVLRITPHFRRDASHAVAYDPVGGLQVQTRRLTEALDARGVAQTVLTTRLPEPSGGPHIGRSSHLCPVGLAWPPVLAPWLMPLTWALAVLWYVMFNRGRFDVIHLHLNHWLATRFVAHAAAASGLPLVVSYNTDLWVNVGCDTRQGRLLRRLAGKVDRWTLQLADAVVFLTEGARQGALPAAMRSKARALVIPDAIDPTRFAAEPAPEALAAFRARHPLPSGRPVVLFAGRIRSEKGWAHLPRVVRDLKDHGAFLLVAGDGPDRAQLRAALQNTAATTDWRITGFLTQDDIRIAMACADVLVMPSEREAFGSVLLEAMAAGLPSVAFSVGGISEVAGSPPAIELVAEHDAPAMAASVRRLLDDEDRYRVLARRGRARVADFGLSQTCAVTIDLYASLTRHATASPAASPSLAAKPQDL